MKEIISSLDIGSSTVKLIVGEYYDGEVNVLAVSEVKSRGVKRGLIASPEDALVSIKEAFSRCEEMLNIKIDKVILNVPSYYAEFVASEGSHKINNESGLVESDDLLKCLQSCVYNKVPNNKEFISITPTLFKADDKVVSDPKGVKCNNLEVKAIISLAPKKNVYTLIALLENINVTVVDINFGSVSDYYEFKNSNMDKKNTAVVKRKLK